MGLIGCPKTSAHNYHSTPRSISDERTAHLHCGGSLRSHRCEKVQCLIAVGSLTVLKVRSKFARIPGGGSNTKMRPALSRFTGSFGFISMVRKSRKAAWGCKLCSFFSSCTNHWGARCTFFSITHLHSNHDLCSVLFHLQLVPFYFDSTDGTKVAGCTDNDGKFPCNKQQTCYNIHMVHKI